MNVDTYRGVAIRSPFVHWQTLVLRGIVALLFGILSLVWPGISLIVFLTIFGIYAFVDGIASIVSALATEQGRRNWVWLLIIGLAGIAAGVITFAYPGMTVLVLLYIIAAWAIVTGVFEIIMAIEAHMVKAESRWLWGISAVLGIILGILLYSNPLTGILSLVWLVGFFALVFGFAQIMLGIRIRGVESPLRTAMQH